MSRVFGPMSDEVRLPRVTEVCLKLDEREEGFRIVRLAPHPLSKKEAFAFVWGNISASLGDEIPAKYRRDPEDDRGVELCVDYEEAVKSWCARAMWYDETNPALMAQMLELAGVEV